MIMCSPVLLSDDAVADIKAYLRIETDDEAALLSSLIAAAVTRAEQFCGQLLIRRAVTERMVARHDWQRLGVVPVAAIVGLESALSSIPLATPQFAIDLDGEGRGWVRVTDPSVVGLVVVQYVAGLVGGWDTLPEALRHAVIRLTAYLYTSRDAAIDAGPPAAVAALLRPYRRVRLS